MQKNLAALLRCLALSLIALHCDVSQEVKSNHPAPLDGKIIIAVGEEYPGYQGDLDPVISLSMRTEKIYGCMNYHIAHDLDRSGDLLTVTIHGVEIGEICLAALGPATATEHLTLGNGSYQLRVVADGLSDIHSLVITEAAISLLSFDTSVSVIDGRLRWRYPRQSFAYYSGTYTGDEWMSNAFDDTLRTHLPLQEITVPSEGVWPYPLSTHGYYYDAPGKFYRYASESVFDSAGALLKAYSQNVLKNKMGAGFSLVNWRNKSYNSWLMEGP